MSDYNSGSQVKASFFPLVIFALSLLILVAGQAAADTSIEEGQIQGTLGKISCVIQDDAKVRLELTDKERRIALARAKVIQKKNQQLVKNLKKQSKVTIKLINNISSRSLQKDSKAGTLAVTDDDSPFSSLPQKFQKKLLKLQKKAGKADIMELDLQPETSLGELRSELENLQLLLDEQKSLLKQANKTIRCCKGCAADVIKNVKALKEPAQVAPGKNKSCGCYTKTVDATLRFFAENNPNNPRQCNAPIYAQWPVQENEDQIASVTVFYTFLDKLYNKVGTPPTYSDIENLGFIYQVSAGNHWVRLGSTGVDGSTIADCSPYKERAEAAYSQPAYVEIRFCPS
ncbi:MAG: hypothetical protein R3A13_02850 [Bdellovibrionota bacterium]